MHTGKKLFTIRSLHPPHLHHPLPVNHHLCQANVPHHINSYSQSCGESEYRQFLSDAADEEVFQGIGNPYAC